MVIVNILAFGHLSLFLDLVKDYLDEHTGLIIIEVSELDASLQVVLDLADHLLVHLDI
jgi:hypothetical protein